MVETISPFADIKEALEGETADFVFTRAEFEKIIARRTGTIEGLSENLEKLLASSYAYGEDMCILNKYDIGILLLIIEQRFQLDGINSRLRESINRTEQGIARIKVVQERTERELDESERGNRGENIVEPESETIH